MALPVFQRGGLEVTNLVFYPAVIAVGETANFSVTIKNISGVNISKCFARAEVYYPTSNDSFSKMKTVILHGKSSADRESISWANGSSHTFEGSFIFEKYSNTDMSQYILRYVGLQLFVVADEVFASQGNSDYTEYPPTDIFDGGYITILSKRDNPTLYFEAERAPTDESASIAASLKLNGDATGDEMKAHGYTAALYKSSEPGGTAEEPIPLNCTITELIDGIENSSAVIVEEFPNISGWLLRLVVTNGYETTSAVVSIPRAFSNMHLSGKTTGGVAFGGFSTSEEGNPKAEFHYRIYPYAGIEGLGITYPQPNETPTDPGEEQLTGDYWIDGKPIYRRTAKGYLVVTSDVNFGSIGPCESVIKMYGFASYPNHTWRIPVNAYINSGMIFSCWIEDANGTVRGHVSPAGANVYVVIEYTKPD